jgi:hypothetical protein
VLVSVLIQEYLVQRDESEPLPETAPFEVAP